MKIDKSLFKGKDLELVNEVVQYFNDANVPVEVRGSVVKGNPRNYRDIDLVVRWDDYLERRDSMMGLVWGMNDVRDSALKIPSFVEEIRDCNQSNQKYVSLLVENRFTIVDDKTNTTIDLCFEAKPGAKELRFVF